MQEIITHSVAETQSFAKEFVFRIKAGDIITLSGALGAGKTTFVQGFAEGLGIRHRILSPTFIIVRSYTMPVSPIAKILYHIDLYRTRTIQDMQSIGLEDILHDPEAITVIEWPERMGAALPKKRWEISLSVTEESDRKMTYHYLSE